jgi:hypothetical protein
MTNSTKPGFIRAARFANKLWPPTAVGAFFAADKMRRLPTAATGFGSSGAGTGRGCACVPSYIRLAGAQKPGGKALLGFTLPAASRKVCFVNTELFRQEIAEAKKAYEKYVICINKTPDEFEEALISLLNKAIKAYEGRGPDLRHGIALDKQITIILSQSDGPRPLCGIYFNLHSPYQRQSLPKTVRAVTEPISGGQEKSDV